MIHVIGDIHGNFKRLFKLLENIPPEDTVIQIGDFGLWPQLKESYLKAKWEQVKRGPEIFFIDGNHDHIPSLPIEDEEMIEIWKNLWFMPRGYVGMVENRRTLFLGGSKSVDRKFRTVGSLQHGWFPEEQLTDSQVDTAVANARAFGSVDLIISHTPPDWIIRKHLSPHGLLYFDIDPTTWIDESAINVEKVWNALGKPELISGHLHRSIVDGNVRVLGIEEVYTLPKGVSDGIV